MKSRIAVGATKDGVGHATKVAYLIFIFLFVVVAAWAESSSDTNRLLSDRFGADNLLKPDLVAPITSYGSKAVRTSVSDRASGHQEGGHETHHSSS